MKSSFALHVGNRVFSIVASIGLTAILARLISPSEYGYFGILLLLAQLTAVLPTAVGTELIQNRGAGDDHSARVLGLTLVWAAAAAVLSLACMPFLPIDTSDPWQVSFYLAQSLVAVPLTSLSAYLDAYQARRGHYIQTIKADFIANLVGSYAITLTLALAGFGAGALILGTAGYFVVKSALQIYGGAWVSPSFRGLGSTIRGSGWLVASQVANYFGRNGDNIVIGRFLGIADLGLYSRAYNLMAKPAGTIGSAVTAIFYPSFAAIQHDAERARAMFFNALTALTLVVAPLSVYLTLFGYEIVSVLLGSTWMDAAVPFQILAISLYFRIGYKMTEAVSLGKGEFKAAALRQFLYAFMVVAFSSIGAVIAGLPGAAAGVAVALAAYFLTSFVKATRLINMSGRRVAIAQAPAMTAAAISGGIAYAFSLVFVDSPLVFIISGGITLSALYIVVVIFFTYLRPDLPLSSILLPIVRNFKRRLRLLPY
jgi:PST family polysaccharide transporter